MGVPRTLKNLMLFHNGIAYIGEVPSVTLPKLTRKLEAWRGGGMDGSVKLDMGASEDLDLEFTAGGPLRETLRDFGGTLDGTLLRFAGAYQNDSTGNVDAIEVTVRGRFGEIDFGDGKVGEVSEIKHTLACSYYKLVWNGVEEIEVDPLNFVFRVGGVDRLSQQRSALGI